jgi:hypothetical protein
MVAEALTLLVIVFLGRLDGQFEVVMTMNALRMLHRGVVDSCLPGWAALILIGWCC